MTEKEKLEKSFAELNIPDHIKSFAEYQNNIILISNKSVNNPSAEIKWNERT